MNIPIDKIKCYILEHRLTHDKSPKVLRCDIIGVSSYMNQPLTFTILVEKNWIYSNIPISWLFHKPIDFTLNIDLDGIVCPQYEIDCFKLSLNKLKIITNYSIIKGEYICSFDFYTDNELQHLIRLENGNFGLFGNNKISINSDFLPNFKKQDVL